MFIYIFVQIVLFQIFLSYFFEFYDQSETLGDCNNSTVESLIFKVLKLEILFRSIIGK